jgi:hypothetical protein
MPNYTFKTSKKPDGSIGYYVNGTELQDKAAYDRIKQKADQIGTQAMNDVNDESGTSMKASEDAFDKAASADDDIFKRAKGGKVKAKKTAPAKKKLHPNW